MRRAALMGAVAVIVAAVVLAFTVSRGGSLPIEQRVLRDGELAGFVAPAHVSVVRDVAAFLRDVPPSQVEADARRLRRAGFVAATTEHLRSTVKPVDRDAISLVVEFERADSARAELVGHVAASRPGAQVTRFSVPGIPGAMGFAQSRGHGRALDIAFTKDRFFYLVGFAFDARGKRLPTRTQLVAAAQRLDHRIR